MTVTRLEIALPEWAERLAAGARRYENDQARMRLAIELSRANVVHGTGGPFGAAVFHRASGEVRGLGMNLVLALQNSVLHAEIVALMMAEREAGSFRLAADDGGCELVTSCEPCAMCLGAIHWSGISRVVIGARREDAQRIHFDEGPVFPASYQYLESRGLSIARDVCREEAVAVLEEYAKKGGVIY